MSVNKRRYLRLDSVINGTFLSREDNTQGDIMMTNFSRDGFKACLDKPIVPGRIIQFQMRYDDQAMPVFATGRVVWVKEKKRDLTYGFDAGIHLIEEDAVLRQKASEYDFDRWHLKQVAEFAQQRGYLAKHFPDSSRKLAYFLPSLLCAYFSIAAVMSFISIKAALIFTASVIAYFLAIFTSTAFWLFTERSHKSLFDKLFLILPVSAGRISAHISYGLFFVKGFFQKKHKI